MTTLGILLIIYLVINIIGFIVGLTVSDEALGLTRLLRFIKETLGNTAVTIVSILFILLFLPMLTVITAVAVFLAFKSDLY